MAHDTPSPSSSGRSDGQTRAQRPPGNRDSGGFRIRLSDNEMQAARALQEAFGLRSTVAVLGFSLRTLAQQLEQGALAELVAQHRAQGEGRPRPQGRRDGEARGGRGEDRGAPRGQRVDPFARPNRPAASVTTAAGSGDGAEQTGLDVSGDAALEATSQTTPELPPEETTASEPLPAEQPPAPEPETGA